jgi:hypothetical protein
MSKQLHSPDVTVSGSRGLLGKFNWRPLLEQLESRETPAIGLSQTAQWLDQGPTTILNGQTTNIAGNNPVVGAVQALATVNGNANIIFAGGPNGGVWRTLTGTAGTPVWEPLTDNLPSLSISDIAIDPLNPNRVIAGIGGTADGADVDALGRVRGDNIGAIFTTNALDANPTWRVLSPQIANFKISNVFVRNGVILVGGDNGVWRSTDDGATFTQVVFGKVYDMAEDPVTLSRFYVSLAGGNFWSALPTVARSDDNGQFWGDVSDRAQMKLNANTVNIQMTVSTQTLVPGGPPVNSRVYVGVVNNNPPPADTRVNVDAKNVTNTLSYPSSASARRAQLTSMTYSDNFGGNWFRMDTPRYLGGFISFSKLENSTVSADFPHRLRTGDQVYINSSFDNNTTTPALIQGNNNWQDPNTGQIVTPELWDVEVIDAFTFTIHDPQGRDINTGAVGAKWGASGTSSLFTNPPGIPTGFQQLFEVNPGENGEFFQLGADPNVATRVYIGGGRQELPFQSEIGAATFTANLWRGETQNPVTNKANDPNKSSFYRSIQWTPITNDPVTTLDPVTQLGRENQQTNNQKNGTVAWPNNSFTGNGTAPPADTRELLIDSNGRLLYGSGGGFYTLPAPTTGTSDWVSVNGNLGLGQLWSASWDTANNVAVGGFQDTGAADQSATGSSKYNSIFAGIYNKLYDQANAYNTGVDNSGFFNPNQTIRYTIGTNFTTFTRRVIDNTTGAVVNTQNPTFASQASPGIPFSALQAIDKLQNIPLTRQDFENQYIAFNLNTVDNRRGIYGTTFVYEDSDPNFNVTGAIVNNVTPTGMTGRVRTFSYGGKLNNLALPQILYVGTTTGQLWVRGQFGIDFAPRTPPGAGQITDIVTDPDDYRHVFVLKGGDKIWESTDAGVTWTDQTFNLVGPPVADGTPGPNFLTTELRTIAVWDPNPGNTAGGVTLVAGGRGGVYRRTFDPTCNRTFWSEYGAGLPNSVVQDVQLYGNRMVAGTFGRGVWTVPDVSTTLGAGVTLLVDGDANANTITITGDPFNPNAVVVNDGQGNTGTFVFGTFDRIQVTGGGGADTIIIGSEGLNPTSNLRFIQYEVAVIGGGDAGDTLIINGLGNVGDSQITYTDSSIGASIGDSLFGLCGNVMHSGFGLGAVYVASGTGIDTFYNAGNVMPTGGLHLNGGAGSDRYLFGSGIQGLIDIYDQVGPDTLGLYGTLNAETFVVTPSQARVNALDVRFGSSVTAVNVDGGGGNDSEYVYGTTGNDNLYYLQFAPRFSQVLGLPPVITNSNIQTVVVDGNGGSDNLFWQDRSNTSLGSAGNPSAGLVYQPKGPAAGRLYANGGLFSDLHFVNVGGVVGVNGDPFGTGTRDAVSVLGFSTAGQPTPYGESTSTNGTDFVAVTDSYVALTNAAAGLLPTLYLNTSTGGATTFSNLFVRTGNEAAGTGDYVGGTPTLKLNIVIDGGDPTALPGDTLTAYIIGRRTIAPTTDPVFGPPQTRINQIRDKASFGYINFENIVVNDPTSPPPPPGVPPVPPTPVASQIFAVGTDAGSVGEVRVYDAKTGALKFGPIIPFPGFTGGIRVATGDVTGDGTTDFVVAAGPNGGPRVIAYDGTTGKPFADFFAFGPAFSGGVSLALGDVNNDGFADYVLGAGAGGGPNVRVLNGQSRAVLYDFFAYAPTFTGGVNVASGDVNGDSRADIVVGAGAGGGPNVRVYDGATGAKLADFFAYALGFTGGVNVAAADVTGDGLADVITGAGFGGGPNVKAFTANGFTEVRNFFVNDPSASGAPPVAVTSGVRVAAIDWDGDGVFEILTGRGKGTKPFASVYRVSRLTNGTVVPVFDNVLNVNAFGDTFGNGIFVG